MNFLCILSAALVGAAIIIVQPQLAVALTVEEINAIAEEITVKIIPIIEQDREAEQDREIEKLIGTGIIFERKDNTYSVLTSKHVAAIYKNCDIQTAKDGKRYRVNSRREIPELDLMILQFESNESYDTADLGDSGKIARLMTVYVVGFPAIQMKYVDRDQADIDIVSGEIRRVVRAILEEPTEKNKGYALVYTNPTLPGSSGGPVLDEDGRLVGINGQMRRDIITGRDESYGIPINLFLAARDKLKPSNELEILEINNSSGIIKITNRVQIHPGVQAGDYDNLKLWRIARLQDLLITDNWIATARNSEVDLLMYSPQYKSRFLFRITESTVAHFSHNYKCFFKVMPGGIIYVDGEGLPNECRIIRSSKDFGLSIVPPPLPLDF